MFETNFNDDHKHKNIKCYNSRSISNNNENEFNYPNNISKSRKVEFQFENNLKDFQNKSEIINKIYNNTFIIFAFDKINFSNLTFTYGTYMNIIQDFYNINIILTTFSLISKIKELENLSIYAISLKNLSKKNLRLILNKLQIIFSNNITLSEKSDFLNKLLSSTLSNYFIPLKIKEDFIKKREETINFIESSEEMIKELKYGQIIYYPILDILFLISENNEKLTNFTPIKLNNKLKMQKEKINILTISSIPYLDYYNFLNIYIKRDEYNFYNYNEIFNEEIISICFGNLNQINLNAYFYRDINFFKGGEILYDQTNLIPIGISYIPQGQQKNFHFMDEKEYNIYISFTGKIFKKFIKYYFNVEELYIKNKDLFNVFSDKDDLNKLNISVNLIDNHFISDNSLVNNVFESFYQNENKKEEEVRLVKKKISVYNNNNNIGNQFSNNFLNEIQLRYNKQENKFNNLSIPIKEKEKERDDLLLELKTIKENFLNLNYKES